MSAPQTPMRYPGPVEFTTSRRRYVFLTLLGLLLVAGSVVLILAPVPSHPRPGQSPWVGWLGLVLFLPATSFTAYRIARPTVALRLDAEGLVDTSSPSSVGRIGWDEVAEARAFGRIAAPTIGVLVREPEAVLARLGPVKQAVASGNLKLGDTPVWISGTVLPVDEATALINAFREGWAHAHQGEQPAAVMTPVGGDRELP